MAAPISSHERLKTVSKTLTKSARDQQRFLGNPAVFGRLAANAPLQLPNSHCCQNQTSRSFRAALWLGVFLHDDASTGLLSQEPAGGAAELSRWAPCTVLFLDSRSFHCPGMKNHKDRTFDPSCSKSSRTKVLCRRSHVVIRHIEGQYTRIKRSEKESFRQYNPVGIPG